MARLAFLCMSFASGTVERCDTSSEDREELRADVRTRLEALGYSGASGMHSCHEPSGAGASNPDTNACFLQFPLGPQSKLAGNPVFQMRDGSDVLVFVGCAPEAAPLYMGYTPYLLGFGRSTVVNGTPMAQITDTLNHLVMNNTGPAKQPWGATTALLLTADETSDADARAALEAAGFPRDAIKTVVMPEEQLSLGIGAERLRPGPSQRLGGATAPDSTNSNESSEQLLTNRQAIGSWARRRGLRVGEVLPLRPIVHDGVYTNGTECVTNRSTQGCFGESDDAAYFHSDALDSLALGHLDILVGSNQAATGMAVYSSVAVYTGPRGGDQASAAGGPTMDSFDFAGSARRYAPEHLDAGDLFAINVSYEGCAPDERWCLNTTVTGKDQVMFYATRAYLNPETGTGPDPDQLAQSFLVRLRPGAIVV